MTITLTEEQYRHLVGLLHLGSRVANAFREEPVPEYDEVEQAVMARAPAFKADDIVVFDVKERRWFLGKEFDRRMHEMIDEYDLEAFYDELTYGLAHRDMILDIGEEEVKGMSDEDFRKAEEPYLEKYDDEFEKYGIERLYVTPGEGRR